MNSLLARIVQITLRTIAPAYKSSRDLDLRAEFLNLRSCDKVVLYSLVKFVDLLSILMNDSIWIRNDALSLDPGLRELVIYCLVHVVGVSSSY